jgi:hypothetical protein
MFGDFKNDHVGNNNIYIRNLPAIQKLPIYYTS